MRIGSELRDLAAAAVFSTLLFTAGLLVPVVGPPAGFLSTAPLIWHAARRGPGAGLLSALLATAVLLPLFPTQVALVFAAEHALPAPYLGWRIRRGRGVVAGCAVAAVVIAALAVGSSWLLAGAVRDPVQVLESELREALAEIERGAAVGPQDPAATALGAGLEKALDLLRPVLPALALIGIFVECALNSLLAVRVLSRSEPGFRPPDLRAFSLPDWLVWAFISLLALSLTPSAPVAAVAVNALIPLALLYLLQGLSILLHFAAQAPLARIGLVLLASAVLIFPWLLALPLSIGLLDFKFGFRRRWPPPAA